MFSSERLIFQKCNSWRNHLISPYSYKKIPKRINSFWPTDVIYNDSLKRQIQFSRLIFILQETWCMQTCEWQKNRLTLEGIFVFCDVHYAIRAAVAMSCSSVSNLRWPIRGGTDVSLGIAQRRNYTERLLLCCPNSVSVCGCLSVRHTDEQTRSARQANRQIDKQALYILCLSVRHTDTQTDRQTDKDRQTHAQPANQRVRHLNKKTDGQTDRQTQADTHTHTLK